MLTGEVQLYDGSGWKIGRPGDFMFVSEGGLHGFRGANHASMLLLFSRRSTRGLLRDPGERGDDAEEERAEFMVRHDTYWV